MLLWVHVYPLPVASCNLEQLFRNKQSLHHRIPHNCGYAMWMTRSPYVMILICKSSLNTETTSNHTSSSPWKQKKNLPLLCYQRKTGTFPFYAIRERWEPPPSMLHMHLHSRLRAHEDNHVPEIYTYTGSLHIYRTSTHRPEVCIYRPVSPFQITPPIKS